MAYKDYGSFILEHPDKNYFKISLSTQDVKRLEVIDDYMNSCENDCCINYIHFDALFLDEHDAMILGLMLKS